MELCQACNGLKAMTHGANPPWAIESVTILGPRMAMALCTASTRGLLSVHDRAERSQIPSDDLLSRMVIRVSSAPPANKLILTGHRVRQVASSSADPKRLEVGGLFSWCHCVTTRTMGKSEQKGG